MSAKWISAGKTVWEINKNDLPGFTLHDVQEVSRLSNRQYADQQLRRPMARSGTPRS